MSDYESYGQPPPLVRPRRLLSNGLLVVYVAVFLLEHFFADTRSRSHFVSSTFALSLGGLKEGNFWQLLTYQFMHGGDLHLIMNCLGLYFIGPTVELLLGRVRFLVLYFGGGIVGGLLQLLMGVLTGGPDVAMVGASGGLMALLGVVACQFWNQRLRLLIMFILPVSLTGRSMLILLTVVDLAGAFFHDSVIAHYAHLGGLYAGFLGMKFLQKRYSAQ
jgi:membrane associated rhomboid family serine protease